MKLTKDFSQCQRCIFHVIATGKEMCCCTGDMLFLDGKEENCPDFITAQMVALNMMRKKKIEERQKKEAQERLEEEKRKKEEYERSHPLEFWQLLYNVDNPLNYYITHEVRAKPCFRVDDDYKHYADSKIILYYSTEEKAYQKYRKVLENRIESVQDELLALQKGLAALDSRKLTGHGERK